MDDMDDSQNINNLADNNNQSIGSVQNLNQNNITQMNSGKTSKEVENQSGLIKELAYPAGIKEIELPKEVSAAGVHRQPTIVTLPPNLVNIGLESKDIIAEQKPIPEVNLPISDDQIAEGLKQSLYTSWRWIAEKCIWRLKQVHVAIKNIHGKIIRVKI